MEKLDSIRASLQSELSQSDINIERVLELSSQIANADPNNVRFSVDASHITKLGLELVGKQETAVAELVKNGYDADATRVDLFFENVEREGGKLTIRDDGHGMTRAQLVNGFMRISTRDKVDNPRSPQYGRQRAGRKGIGRFAAQRLGAHLVILTQTADANHALKVEIDWENYSADRDIGSITNRIMDVEKLSQHGTTLVIDILRDAWTEAEIKRSFRYITDLLQPFPLAQQARASDEDPGFKARFYKKERDQVIAIVDEKKAIFEHALAVIEGRVDSAGNGFWSLLSRKYPDYEEKDRPLLNQKNGGAKPFTTIKGTAVSFKAYFFLVTDDCVPKLAKGPIEEVLRKSGGIRLYRNGFRVPPYGEPFDDWLGIDASHKVKEIPPVRNNRFIGIVEVFDPEGICFEETSSREGLVENDAFAQLRAFVFQSLESGIRVIKEARSKDPRRKKTNKPSSNLTDEVMSIINELDTHQAAGKDATKQNDLSERIFALGQTAQELLDENSLLRILASMGLAIAEFTHEIRHILAAIFANMARLEPLLIRHEQAQDATDSMKLGLSSLRSYTHYFDAAISDNVFRELQPLELRDVVHAFLSVVEPALERDHIHVHGPIFDGYDLFTRPMHKSEWASILFNLFTNAVKAIRRAGREGKLSLAGGRIDDMIFLDFSDNGDGIPEEYCDRIFNAFFTTSSAPTAYASESEQLIGTGLGLKIVKDIVEALEGEITLTAPPAGYSTCFRIEIPAATSEQLKRYDA